MQRLVIIASLLLVALLASPSLTPVPARAQAEEVTISIENFAFSPDTIEIPAGTTVTWTNNDRVPHTVTADDGTFDSGTLNSGTSFSFTFAEPGTYSYHCAFHTRMTAQIIVTEAVAPEATPAEEPAPEPTATPEEPATPQAITGEAETVGITTDGGNALEFVGKIDQRGGDFTIYGYVTRIAGLEPPDLFSDADPANWNETTARFTLFGAATLTTRSVVDNRLFVITAEGTVRFYFNPAAGASFDAPESFFSGTEVSEAQIAIRNVLGTVAPDTGVTDGGGGLTLTTVTPFDLDGRSYQFGTPNGTYRVAFSGVGVRLEPAEPRAVLAIAGYAVPALPVAAPQAEATPAAVTVDLSELNDSGISGTATLRDVDGATEVTIAVTGAAGDHPAHIHAGTCDSLDPNPAFPLTPIEASGASVTTVEVSLDALLSESFAINVHKSPEEIGIYVACGEITG